MEPRIKRENNINREANLAPNGQKAGHTKSLVPVGVRVIGLSHHSSLDQAFDKPPLFPHGDVAGSICDVM